MAPASVEVTERVLDAACALYAARGPRSVSMAEVATSARVSRATLYRYFPDKRELQLACVHREARRVAARVAREAASVSGREARLVTAVLSALRLVRGSPLLAGWITSDGTAVTASLVGGSDVLEALGIPFTGDDLGARWLLRSIFVLLLVPGRSVEEERAMVERFLAPLVLADPVRDGVGSEQHS